MGLILDRHELNLIFLY